MKIKNIKIIFLLSIFLIFFGGCIENIKYPDKPEIEFKDFQIIRSKDNKDSLGILIFSFTDGDGDIEVKDQEEKWRVVLVCEAKHQGKDIENISQGILVGKNSDQVLMVAGNAIERSHKNINEIRNLMIDEKHFPYVLFLQGSNFLTETISVTKPDGTEVILKHDNGVLNRIDRLTASNYSLPINQNNCENIFISIDGKSVMLQSVSIYAKPKEWTVEEMLPIMMTVSTTSLKILGLTE